MTVAEIIETLQFHVGSDYSEDDLLVIVNGIARELAHKDAYPFREAVDDVTVKADGTVYSIPGQEDVDPLVPVQITHEIGAITEFRIPSIGAVLAPRRKNKLAREFRFSFTESGYPRFYYFDAQNLCVFRQPGTDTTGELSYLRVQQPLAADSTEQDILLPPRFHDLIIDGCLEALHLLDDDLQKAGYYQARYLRRRAEAENEMWMWQDDQAERMQVHAESLDEDWDENVGGIGWFGGWGS